MTLHQYQSSFITQNKKAYYKYFIEQEFEAGLSLHGWEVKSLRAGKANISDSYVLLINGEAFLFGAYFQPLVAASNCDPMRTRKLLLKQRELYSLFGRVNRDGYTIVALSLYWKNAWVKLQLSVAKGKTKYDKRTVLKEREWQRNKAYLMKKYGK